MKNKFDEWFRRYIPLEIVATITALIGGFAAHACTDNGVIIAFAATWSENIGYYGTAIVREFIVRSTPAPRFSIEFLRETLKIPRDLVFEFGIAEFFDSFVVRPFFMFVGPVITGNLALGLIVGKLAADGLFYTVAIIFYEIRKKMFR